MKATIKSSGLKVETTGITKTEVDDNGHLFRWFQVHKIGANAVFSVKESDLKYDVF